MKVFRYAFTIHNHFDKHVDVGEYIEKRFEVYVVANQEKSEKGVIHFQGYGETETPWSDSDQRQFRQGGKYYSLIDRNIKGQRVMVDEAKEDRASNNNYCLKQAHESWAWVVCTLTGEELENAKKESFEYNALLEVSKEKARARRANRQVGVVETVLEWYAKLDEPKPEEMLGIAEKMYEDKVLCRSSQFSPALFKRLSDLIVCKMVSGKSYERQKDAFMDRILKLRDS